MPGLLRGVARTAVVAGTATAVSNRVSRRQAGRWQAQQAEAQDPYAQAPAAQQQPPPPAPAAVGIDDKIGQLKQLAELKEQGILTDEEFAAQKARILNG
ncbi:SHOCT domain-containing protein [Streptomyces sp. NPDC048387]|uniref:SHOCT domain-containing protein n=1 Tax=unclassified Streptomyces TaxID=2593676 RepID=UPI0033BFB97B